MEKRKTAERFRHRSDGNAPSTPSGVRPSQFTTSWLASSSRRRPWPRLLAPGPAGLGIHRATSMSQEEHEHRANSDRGREKTAQPDPPVGAFLVERDEDGCKGQGETDTGQ